MMNYGFGVLVVICYLMMLNDVVLGTCDHLTVSKIVKKWDSNIPHDILKQSVGMMTYVYLSPSIVAKDDVRVHCLVTSLAPDMTTATDIYVYRDLFNKYTVTYKKAENKGKITLKSDGLFDESQYVVSFKNHVLAFWQCVAADTTGKLDSLVGIAVDVNHVKDAQADILEAKRTLKSLGLASGADLTPCTPDILQYLKF